MSAPQFTPGPWHYRPERHDDWGMVRASPDRDGWPGHIIANARAGRDFDVLGKEADEHRHNRTDPFEANARLIAAAPDYDAGVEQMLAYEQAGGDGWWKGWEMLKAAHAKARGDEL